MARPYRLQDSNCFYHITSRGDDRKKIFISEYDFNQFLEYLLTAKSKFKFNLFAYCLMSNHYHLFIETLQPNLSKIMQYLNGSYTAYYNTKRKKTGHLFQGRFKSIMVDEDSYFLELTRYIHLNPVKAKIVECPEDYKWSSYKGYLKPKHDKYIDYSEIDRYIPMKPRAYAQFVLGGIGNKKPDLFDKVYAGFFLGNREFVKGKLAKFKPEVAAGDFAHKRKLTQDISIDDIIEATSKAFNVDKDKIVAKKHSHCPQRKVVIYIARKVTAMTNKHIAIHFGISDTAVIKADNSIQVLMAKDKGLKKKTDAILSAFRV